MAKKKRRDGKGESAVDEHIDEPVAVDTETEADADGAPAAEDADEVEILKERLQRKVAELENFRKQTERRMSARERYVKQEIIRTILPVVDNFESLMKAVECDQDPKMIIAGFGMIREQLSKFLVDHQVRTIEARGQVFDPEKHDAMSREETTEHEPNRIIKVIQEGYAMGDDVIRAARVTVASAPAAEQEETDPRENGDPGEES